MQTDALADTPAFFPLLAHLSPCCLLLTKQFSLPPHGLNMCICGNKHQWLLCRQLTLHAISASASVRHCNWCCQECLSHRPHYLQGILRVHQCALALLHYLYTEHQTWHQEKLLWCSLLVLSILLPSKTTFVLCSNVVSTVNASLCASCFHYNTKLDTI